MNSVVLVGRAGQDPKYNLYDSGKKKASFSLAVSRWDYKTKAETTDWFNVELWEKAAEVAAEYVKKGSLICIDGRLTPKKWTTPDGEQKEYFVISSQNLRLLGKKGE